MARSGGTGTSSKFGLLPTICFAIAILYIARDVLIPLAVAILLAFLLTPAVTWLQRRHLGRLLSIILVVAASLSVVGFVTWVVEQQFVEVAAQLPNYRNNIQEKWLRLRGASSGSLAKAAAGVEATFKSIASTEPAASSATSGKPPAESARQKSSGQTSEQEPPIIQEYSDPWSWPSVIAKYSGQVLSPLASLGLVLVFVIFILANRTDLRDRILRLVGDARLHVTTQAIDDAATRITHYLQMQSVINAVYGICVGIGLWIIGASSAEGRFPNVMLWAMLAMLLRFLPYLGPWIAAALPIVLSLALFSSAGIFIATIGLYVGLELVTSNVLEPWLYGASTGISAVAVLASAVFWTWLWGPVGLLLSTPMTVCLVVLGKYVPQMHFLGVLLGDEQALEPSYRIYQRLLSLDQEEAGELLHKYWKEFGPERTFDEILIPALEMAEKDRYAQTLDPNRETFICQAMRDLIEELAEGEKKRLGLTGPTNDSGITILCLPAKSQADEIVGLMLAQLLEFKGLHAIAASQVSLASEMLDQIEAQKSPIVCISALPPAAVAHARYLCKRLHLRFRDLPTTIGLWNSKTDPKISRDRLSCDQSVRVVNSLKGALAEIHEMIQPLLLQKANGPLPAEPNRTGEEVRR
ncbi:MAG: AI-2E family transporter [Tepidisphaeraceae bacterium]|jgi:predicted PurR-regulated permease PerM